MIYSSKYIFFAAVIVFLIVPAEINACSCAGSGSPCEAYGAASAVFTGIVTGGSYIQIKDGKHELFVHPTTSVITDLPMPRRSITQARF
jgi:hypothetical protein